jgi:hypothetical protein
MTTSLGGVVNVEVTLDTLSFLRVKGGFGIGCKCVDVARNETWEVGTSDLGSQVVATHPASFETTRESQD